MGGNTLGDQIPNIGDTTPDLIPPNEQAVEQRNPPNPSEEHEPVGKLKTQGYQGKMEKFDAPLDLIPPAGKAVGERIYINTSEEQEPIVKEKTPLMYL